MHSRAYSLPVKVGNWFEEQCAQEAEHKEYDQKKSGGNLLVQTSEAITRELMTPVRLAVSGGGEIRFGDCIMLLNSTESSDTGTLPQGMNTQLVCLAIGITPSSFSVLTSRGTTRMNSGDNGKVPTPAIVNCTGTTRWNQPEQRNTFIVRSCGENESEVLQYGEPFKLVNKTNILGEMCMYCEGSSRLATPVLPGSASSQASSTHKPSLQCLHPPTLCCQAYPRHYEQWVAQHRNPQLRMEYEGEQIQANEPLILTHMKSGRHLALERRYSMATIFGREMEVCCNIFLDGHRAETSANLWTMATLGHGSFL